MQKDPIGDIGGMTDVLHEAPLPDGTLAPEFDLPTGPDASVALGGISVDGVWCHRAFARHRGIEYPLVSDFETGREERA